MTSAQALQRSEKSQNLKVFHLTDSPWYYVESEEGKICYKVSFVSETEFFCNCADFAKGFKNDATFRCKHLIAVMNSITDGDAENIRYLERWRPKLDESYVKKIDDKDFVLYAGLLDVAHQKNLISVDVELIQFPSDDNKQTAICKATVKTFDGKTFSDIGDANPQNCNSKVSRHLIRMASTRAKARAFRDCDNIGLTALEELGDLNEVISNKPHSHAPVDNVKAFTKPIIKSVPVVAAEPVSANVKAEPKEAPVAAAIIAADTKVRKTKTVKPGNGNGNGNGETKQEKVNLMSEAQRSALYNVSRRRGISSVDIESRCMEKYGVPIEQMNSVNAGEFIRYLQQAS
jgi:hypothetical protein